MFEYHSHSKVASLGHLKVTELGLSSDEVKNRIEKYGYNEMPTEKPLSQLMIFLSQFNNTLIYILLIVGVLSFFLKEYVNSGVIFAAVIINVTLGYFQESKANNAIQKLKQLVEHKAFVLRNGHEIYLDSRLLVPGDIILLKAGNRIPADARLIEAIDLQINESSLTGESLPSRKQDDKILTGAALGDQTNMVFAGTVVVSGLGRAVVVRTGANTEIGRIADLVKDTKEEQTPLQIRLNKFSRFLGVVFVTICFLIIIFGLFQKRDLLEIIETAVAVGVASIPEGLSVAVTFILALGMQSILKKKALTRKLIATETLGSITVICTDKTGTLTEGKMHVAHIVIGEKEYEVKDAGSRQDKTEAKLTELALQIGMMSNNAMIENPDDELSSWRFIGTPTDTAVLSAAIQAGLSKEQLLKNEPLIDEIPFSSENKFMLSLHKKSANSYVLYEKGAPEKLLAKSINFYHHDKITKLNETEKSNLIKTYEKLTAKGLRVIGLAIREIKSTEKIKSNKGKFDLPELDKNLTFVGFIAIKDPLRPEAKETIKICREAGIRPIIITGDHKLTAKAIAEEVGFKTKAENILTGEELDKISDEKLLKIIGKVEVYARVSPHHKLRIVKLLQQSGEVVAMTGDGINDSPALKAADIGISLGNGTDVAKEASDLVLLDNNFQTIIAAIEQGRTIFSNIRKTITYTISDSFSEIIIITGSILFNIPLAILPAQILWINIVNDGFPNFSFAFEPNHGTAMKQKPIKRETPLLSKEMKAIIFGVGFTRDILIFILFYYLVGHWDLKYLQTFIFAVLGMKSLLGIFSLKSFHLPIWKISIFSNPKMIYAVIASLFLLVSAIEFAPLQNILSTTSLNTQTWIMVVLIGLMNIILIEIVKMFFTDEVKTQTT